MKRISFALLLCILLAPTNLMAQDFDYHPALSDNFMFAIGAFRSNNSFTLEAKGLGTDINDESIDFDDAIGVSEHSTLANVQLRWKFGKGRKWSIWGQYFSNDAKGKATLTKDVEWQDEIFKEGTFVEGGVEIEIARLFLGRSLIKNERNDFGIGAGLHNLDLAAYIGGEVIVEEVQTEYRRAKASNSQPLPNIGTWYNFSPARRWLLHGRIDWISADIGNYDGSMWNVNFGANYQAFDHVGFDLSYQYFNLNLNVDKSDWRGGVDLTYSGPMLAMTVNW